MARNGTQQRGVFDSERRFRLLVEGIVDYAICMLDPNGIVTNWNAGAKRIKGYEAAEVIGRHFGMFYLPEDREAGMPARSLAAARENGKFEAEGWLLRKDVLDAPGRMQRFHLKTVLSRAGNVKMLWSG